MYADNSDKMEFVNMLCGNEEGIVAAHTVLSRISEDEANWLRQMSEEKKARDFITATNYAERRGMKKGIRQGERNARLETARNFLSKGIPASTIAECTGLTLDEV